MIGLYEFNRLAEDQQYAYVFGHGRFLASYVEDEIFTASLYHAGDFFVEVWYNPPKTGLRVAVASARIGCWTLTWKG